MGKLKKAILLSFRTKVLVPVVGVMVLLLAVSMWLVNRRVTSQLRSEAAKQMAGADAALKVTQKHHEEELFRRFSNIKSEPRFQSAVSSLFNPEKKDLPTPEHQKTFRDILERLIRDNVAEVIVLTTGSGQRLTVAKNPRLDVAQFELASDPAIVQALEGTWKFDAVESDDRLFDIVSLPIQVNDSVVGVVTFGVENTLAQKFRQYTQSDLLIFSASRVVSSTLNKPELHSRQNQLLARAKASPNGGEAEEILLDGDHYLCLTGRLSRNSGVRRLGYVILYSYERPLQTLRETQWLILAISAMAILLGTSVVWFSIHRVVEPLEELRDSVEAVGQGDLSRRIEVSSMDECGELAVVFNQMTENLRLSREQLEATVDTLKSTQAQLIQSEKLSGIGQFVAGVAHELNNPLTSVMGFSELLQQGDVNPQQKRHLEMIHKSALRCQKIVQSLLSFSRRHQPEQKLVCVNSLVEAAVEILQYQLRTSNIEVVTCLDPRLPQAMVDSHQIQQVFLNIINNARQAIETHRPRGAIRISTDTCGTNVRVIFSDNGPGISVENLSKVFDPFFTTKEVGKGTGLGLSLCYGIVKEHGGVIKASSKPGQGATFTVELPIASPATENSVKHVAPLIEQPDPREGAGRKVLVIDDEEPILQMVSEALGRCGYEVDAVADGETALQRVHQRSYDLALCDWKMPGLNGQQIYERLRSVKPALSERMIFITGDVVNERTQEFLQRQKKICLTKPFSLTEFRNAVNTALANG